MVPFPYIATLQPLPASGADAGDSLYTMEWNADGSIASATPSFAESALTTQGLLPQNRAVFLMCGGARYAGMMRTLLIYEQKLYNVGANWT